MHPVPDPPVCARPSMSRLPGVLAALVCILGALAACADPPPPLQVGEITFTDESLRGLSNARLEELALISIVIEAGIRDEEDRLGAPARARELRTARIRILREEVVLSAAGVTESDLQARYEADPDLELEVRHLVTLAERGLPEPVRREARERAETALQRIRAGEPFPEVAGAVSDEPGAARRGGLLDPGRRGTWVDEFWEAARSLGVDETSGVVETEYGFHVLHLESRRELPFEEGRARIVRTVAGELGGAAGWERWTDEALAGGAVEREAVAALEIGAPGPLGAAANDAPRDAANPTEPDPILARWPGGELTRAALLQHLGGGTRSEWTAFADGSPEARVDNVAAVADTARLDELARERGLEPPESDLAAIQREWEQRVVTWTSFLALPDEIRSDAAAALALEALRLSDQNARIARSELREWSPTLRHAYPVRRTDANAP